jgi:hypothetical protein
MPDWSLFRRRLQFAQTALAATICAGLYVLLYNERLRLYVDFYKLEYSSASKIAQLTILFSVWMASFIVLFLVPVFTKHARIVLIGIAMIDLGAVISCPFFGPFDFFLATTPDSSNPFKHCADDCMLTFDPGRYRLGISEDSDLYVVYSPSGRIRACLRDSNSDACWSFLSTMGMKRYGSCRVRVDELTQGKYFTLATMGCA